MRIKWNMCTHLARNLFNAKFISVDTVYSKSYPEVPSNSKGWIEIKAPAEANV